MSERLTDEELTRLMSDAEDMHSMYWIAAVSELRERRAQDLSADEVEALRGVRLRQDPKLPWGNPEFSIIRRQHNERLAVLDKLIAAAEARR